MNAERNLSPGAAFRTNVRLEDIGFGSTLAGMAAAALVVAAAPALDKGGFLADWMESCTTLVTIAWPIASAAIGVAG
jgi:hypothetical protein